MATPEDSMIRLMEMMQQTQKSMQELLVKHEERLASVETHSSSSETPPTATNSIRIMGDLDKRIPKFVFNTETEVSFADWYSRYEDVFEIDGQSLDDSSKLRLLLGKLEDEAYKRFESHILPNKPKALKFGDAVKILKEIFDLQVSLFTRQYTCWTSKFDKSPHESDQAYGDRINERFHKVMSDIDIEGYKVLRFLVGLKAREDVEHLPYLLSYADRVRKESPKNEVKLQDVIRELKNLRTYKGESELIAKDSNKIQQVQNYKLQQNKHKSQFKKNENRGVTAYDSKSKGGNNNKYCAYCKRQGHTTEECYKKNPTLARKNQQRNYKKDSHVRSVGLQPTLDKIPLKSVNSVRRYTNIVVNGTQLEFLADTGADITTIDIESWKSMGQPALETAKLQLFTADKSPFICKGKLPCEFVINGQNFHGEAFVMEKGSNLLGLDWMSKSKRHQIGLTYLGHIKTINVDNIEAALLRDYPDVFKDGLGTCTKEKANLKLKTGVTPKFRPPRPVAYAAREAVEKELDRLLDLDVIKPVTYSKWAAPIVCVAKKETGKLRVCIDFSTGLNEALEDNPYPLPTADDIFASLNGGQYFSQIDLSDAYLQIELDEESKDLVTVNTHRGLFRYNRLPFGIKTAPAIFQSLMNKMVCGLEGVTTYLDDILVTGRTREEHDQNLKNLFDRVDEYGFRLKISKCAFLQDEIKFLGYIINKYGRKPDPEKIKALISMKEPEDMAQLKSFLGMISYYGNFLPGVKKFRGPLDNLTHKNQEWNWDNSCKEAFRKLIELLASDLNLCHYNPNLPILVAADACNYGIGGVIYHKFPDGSEKPIHHISKALSETEKKYSQIEKEALALVIAVTKFHKFLYGRKFTLRTDHRPLLAIFGSKKGVPTHTTNRLSRWATILLGYNFSLEYVPTNKFGLADGLSRLMSSFPREDDDVVIAHIETSIISDFDEIVRRLPLTADDIAEASQRDPFFQCLGKCIETQKWSKFSKFKQDREYKGFQTRLNEMSIVKNCIMLGERIAIPIALRGKIMKELHRGHPGILRMKELSKKYVFWPGQGKNIEEYVKSCDNCQLAAKQDRKVPLQPWPRPHRPWERIHIDYAGPLDGFYFLVIVDAYSNWPEILMTKSISAPTTVRLLEDVFSRTGLPETLISDNGTQFTAKEFKEMCELNGIKHIRTPPYHPQANGQAERFVDTLKRSLQKLKGGGEGRVNSTLLNKFLFAYRSTPCPVLENKTPSEVFYGRNIRTTLNLLIPKKEDQGQSYSERMKSQFDMKHGVKAKTFGMDELVWFRKHQQNQEYWIKGRIVGIRGNATYLVDVEDGKTHHAHSNQLRKRLDHEFHASNYQTLLHTFNMLTPRKNTLPEEDPLAVPKTPKQEVQEDLLLTTPRNLTTPDAATPFGTPAAVIAPKTQPKTGLRQEENNADEAPRPPEPRRSQRTRHAPDRLRF